jgi:quercetin dioxygenase-like cupin family protein
MPVVKYDDIDLAQVVMEGAENVSKAIVVGDDVGWDEYVLRVFRLGPGGYTPKHRHGWEHVNYVIQGRGKLTIEGTIHNLERNDFAFVPSDQEHRFENPYDDDFEFICIVPDRGEY